MATPGIPGGQDPFIAGLRLRIRLGRRRIWLMGNRERIALYWQLGRDLRAARADPAEVSEALRREDPLREFSPAQLRWMARFAQAWPDEAEVRARLGAISWHRHRQLLRRLKTESERRRYVARELEGPWEGKLP